MSARLVVVGTAAGNYRHLGDKGAAAAEPTRTLCGAAVHAVTTVRLRRGSVRRGDCGTCANILRRGV